MYQIYVLLLIASASVAARAATAQCVKPGVSRWAIKTSLPTERNTPVALTLQDITALPTPAGANDDKELDTRYTDDLGNGLKEGSLVRVSGWVRLIATDPDCDYHIQMTPTNEGLDGTVIVEVPTPNVEYEKSPEVRDSARKVRRFLKSRILNGQEPSGRGGNRIGKAYVEVVGPLFLDGHHLPNCDSRGKQQMHATTCWEIHPVISAHFARRPQH